MKDKFFVGLTNADGTMTQTLFNNDMFEFSDAIKAAVGYSIENKTRTCVISLGRKVEGLPGELTFSNGNVMFGHSFQAYGLEGELIETNSDIKKVMKVCRSMKYKRVQIALSNQQVSIMDTKGF
jgi:hypothetical protein